jgi:hypothetical protein
MNQTTCDLCGESVDVDSPHTYHQSWVRDRTYPTGWEVQEEWPVDKYAHARCVAERELASPINAAEAAEGEAR